MAAERPPAPHTHALAASAKWAAFRKEILDHATRAEGVRDAAARERTDATKYHRADETK